MPGSAVSAAPAGSLSFASTPGAGTVSVVFSVVEYVSSPAVGGLAAAAAVTLIATVAGFESVTPSLAS